MPLAVSACSPDISIKASDCNTMAHTAAANEDSVRVMNDGTFFQMSMPVKAGTRSVHAVILKLCSRP